MRATEIIAEEHRVVWRLLGCLKALVDEACAKGAPDEKAAAELLSLFEWFVESSHQDKEEECLFPRMLACCSPDEAGRLKELFQDHSDERRRLMGMRLHVKGACDGKPASLDRFVANALGYLGLQREHTLEEDSFVLPLANAIFSPEDDRVVLEGFQKIDARFTHLGDLDERVAALGQRFGVEPVEAGMPLHLLSLT